MTHVYCGIVPGTCTAPKYPLAKFGELAGGEEKFAWGL